MGSEVTSHRVGFTGLAARGKSQNFRRMQKKLGNGYPKNEFEHSLEFYKSVGLGRKGADLENR
jgi:hypothetical protein